MIKWIFLVCVFYFYNASAQNNAIFNGGNAGGSSVSCVVTETPLLPIKLLRFNANSLHNYVQLNWATATETDNDYFTIERTANGYSFEEIVKVKGAGNSSRTLTYETTDNHPHPGQSYYRLKQTDFDGHYTYSGLVVVNFIGAEEFALFPNPALYPIKTQLSIHSPLDKTILIVVHDITGREIYSRVVITERNTQSIIAIDPENKLLPGIYIVSATSDDTLYNQKLVIK